MTMNFNIMITDCLLKSSEISTFNSHLINEHYNGDSFQLQQQAN